MPDADKQSFLKNVWSSNIIYEPIYVSVEDEILGINGILVRRSESATIYIPKISILNTSNATRFPY